MLIIAHRLSTLEKCDDILFIKNGEITASGNFSKLRETSTEFQEMLEIKKAVNILIIPSWYPDKKIPIGVLAKSTSFFLEQTVELNKIQCTSCIHKNS